MVVRLSSGEVRRVRRRYRDFRGFHNVLASSVASPRSLPHFPAKQVRGRVHCCLFFGRCAHCAVVRLACAVVSATSAQVRGEPATGTECVHAICLLHVP